MFDCHVHTEFSSDCKMKIEEVIKETQNNNLGVILTEHLDLNFPQEGDFIFNIDEYFEKYSKYRGDKLLLGVELGMRTDCVMENEEIAKNHPFDYVIGSVHLVKDGSDYYDIFGHELYEGKKKEEVYSNYLNHMYNCIKEHTFIDSLGHIDFMCRYSPYEDREIYYENYRETIDSIFKILVEREIALEINTRRFGDKEAVENLMNLYNKFRELGGKYVTIGSDAHVNKNIGNYFSDAFDLAEYCKLKPIYFRNRKKEYMKY
ncbi:histidinol phosphate phosphatase [Clostridium sp. MSJ-11]|uniref:Histidinol-phosphatase n=1 Tax=Clostridium mobile TaxID=2841512 RepID=A0ABS6EKJ3_9CLOT|nr:histidinol phosphate phosphatase [Clostridium mobile]MBU5484929.1 histidinol phosphate phosphatase [Clostridium mobile]